MNEDRRPTAATGPEEPAPQVEDRVAKIKEQKRASQAAESRAREPASSGDAPDSRTRAD